MALTLLASLLLLSTNFMGAESIATTTKRASLGAGVTVGASAPAPGPYLLPTQAPSDWVTSSYAAIVSNPTLSLRTGDPRGMTSAYLATPLVNPDLIYSTKFQFAYVSGYKYGGPVATNFTVYLENTWDGTQYRVMDSSSVSLSSYSYDDCQSCYSPIITLNSATNLQINAIQPLRLRFVFNNNDRNIQIRLSDCSFTYLTSAPSPGPPTYVNAVWWGPAVTSPKDWFCTDGADSVNNPIVSIRSGNPGQRSSCLAVPHKAFRPMSSYTLLFTGASGSFSYTYGFAASPGSVFPKVTFKLVSTVGDELTLWTSPPLNASGASFDACPSCYVRASWSMTTVAYLDYSKSYSWKIEFQNNDRNLQIRLDNLSLESSWYNMYWDGL